MATSLTASQPAVISSQFIDKVFYTGKGDAVSFTSLQDVKVVCYYVGAKWCNASSKFLPLLVDFYQQVNKDSKQLEIVHISCDFIETDYKSLMEGLPWLFSQFNNPGARKFLDENGITTMPSVLVLKKDGTVAKKEGRSDVQNFGVKCFEEWGKLAQSALPPL